MAVSFGSYIDIKYEHVPKQHNILIKASVPIPESKPTSVPNKVTCLAKNIYHEARGEINEGKRAVANVVLNRRDHPDYPDKICDVVYQENKKSLSIFLDV